jgi:hypothetical protein
MRDGFCESTPPFSVGGGRPARNRAAVIDGAGKESATTTLDNVQRYLQRGEDRKTAVREPKGIASRLSQ